MPVIEALETDLLAGVANKRGTLFIGGARILADAEVRLAELSSGTVDHRTWVVGAGSVIWEAVAKCRATLGAGEIVRAETALQTERRAKAESVEFVRITERVRPARAGRITRLADGVVNRRAAVARRVAYFVPGTLDRIGARLPHGVVSVVGRRHVRDRSRIRLRRRWQFASGTPENEDNAEDGESFDHGRHQRISR